MTNRLLSHPQVRFSIATTLKVANAALHPKGDLTIVSAADRSHENSLLNFLDSAMTWESKSRVIAYDLGMTTEGRARIEAAHPRIELRRFNYAAFPPHLDITKNSGDYAWKAPIIKEVADEFGRLICWMDAGNIIRYPLFRLRRLAYTKGYFAQMSDGPIKKWTHPGMIAYFGLPPNWKEDAQNLNTAGVIFDTSDRTARLLIDRWAECSLEKECIAPTGSSRENHRQDQALFTVLAYQTGDISIPRYRHPEFVSHRDVG